MLEQIEKEYYRELERTNINEDTIDSFFNQLDFTDEGGVTPLQFNTEMFIEWIKENNKLVGVYNDDIIRIGMLYTLIYNDTDFEGKNSTLMFTMECDECNDRVYMKYKDYNCSDYKCKKCGNVEDFSMLNGEQ